MLINKSWLVRIQEMTGEVSRLLKQWDNNVEAMIFESFECITKDQTWDTRSFFIVKYNDMDPIVIYDYNNEIDDISSIMELAAKAANKEERELIQNFRGLYMRTKGEGKQII